MEKTRLYLWAIIVFAVIAVNDGTARAVFYAVLAACFWIGSLISSYEATRKEFEKSPWKNCDAEWLINETQLQGSTGTYRWSFDWEWVARVVQRPRGFVLFSSGEALWMPNHGFSSRAEIDKLCQLLHEKLTTFKPSKRILT